MSIEIPGLDTEKGLYLYDDEIDIYTAVLRSFAENTPAVLDSMRNVSKETLDDYAVAAHGLKSTSTTVGAEEARKKALELETLAKAGDLFGVQARNNEFIKYIETLVSNIQNWLNNYDSKN